MVDVGNLGFLQTWTFILIFPGVFGFDCAVDVTFVECRKWLREQRQRQLGSLSRQSKPDFPPPTPGFMIHGQAAATRHTATDFPGLRVS